MADDNLPRGILLEKGNVGGGGEALRNGSGPERPFWHWPDGFCTHKRIFGDFHV